MKKRQLIYWGSGLILLCVWFFAVFVPYQKNKTEIEANAIQAQSQLDDFNRIMVEIPAFLETSNELLETQFDIKSNLYAKDDILKLFDQLEIISKKQKLEVTEIKPSISELLQLNNLITSTEDPLFLNIGITLEGNYKGFGLFIKEIESMPYFRGINKCLITKTEENKKRLRLVLGFKALLGDLG